MAKPKNINLKVRFKSKTFVTAFLAIVALLIKEVALVFFGVDLSQNMEEYLSIAEIVLYLLVFIGVMNDPTVKGWKDSDYSLTKTRPTDPEDSVVKADLNIKAEEDPFIHKSESRKDDLYF